MLSILIDLFGSCENCDGISGERLAELGPQFDPPLELEDWQRDVLIDISGYDEGWDEVIAEADGNDNGVVDEEDFAAARERGRPARRTPRREFPALPRRR